MNYKITLATFICLFALNSTLESRNISLDLNNSSGRLNTMFKECIGAGRANEGLRADWQQQLAMTKKDCGFKYIRMHGLLSDDMAVYREDKNGNPEYNFQYIDVLYDYILSIGMKPFVELGFMPGWLASGNKTIFWWKGNVTPPKSYEKWEALIRNLTLHFTERYGIEEVKTWYFEVWNEPNLKDGFWTGTMEDYFKLYDYAVRGVKSVNKNYKVGGPATAGAAWVPEMIKFCVDNSVPIDFISTHTYGVKQGFLDETATSGTILNKDKWSVSGDVINSRKQIQQSFLPGLELHYTEWSASYTPADPIHDSYHEAAFILQKLKESGTAANSMSYWVFTDIFEEAGPRFTPFHGGFGLLNQQGIKKPAYHAYAFLNMLGLNEIVNSDSSSIASIDENGDFQLLLWDFTNTHPGDSVLNQTYYNRDLPSKSKDQVKIDINNIPKGKYELQIYKTGYRVNDPYTLYLDMGSPNRLTIEQAKKLNESSKLNPVNSEKLKIDGKRSFKRDIEIRENDVILLKFKLIR